MFIKPLYRALKCLLLVGLVVVSQISTLYAVPAYPLPMIVKQPDGTTVTIQMHGDEFFGYATTVTNLPVVRKDDGFFYYAAYSVNGVELTNIRVSDRATKAMPVSVQPITIDVVQALRKKSQLLHKTNNQLTNSPLTKADNDALPSFYITKPLVVLVNFRDIKCTIPNIKSHYNNFMNQKGFNTYGSVKDYYSDNSMGQYTPNFNVYGPIELANNREYYGANGANGAIDVKAYEAVIEAAQALDKQGVSLKDYDQNGDGVLDNIFIIFAGHAESEGAPASAIWPHQWDISKESKYVGGVKLATYGCTSEYKGGSGTSMAGIGTFTHEFGHVLGLFDMYDVDGAKNGQSKGLGSLSLMDGGNYNMGGNAPPFLNVLERYMLGWCQFSEMVSGVDILLEPIGESNQGYIIETDVENEFFVVESRDLSQSWDRYIDVSEPKGMMIYHVDKSKNMIINVSADYLWANNLVNAVSIHECMRIVPSTGTLNFADMTQTLFPGALKVTKFNSNTNPAALSWSGNTIAHMLSNIAVDENGVVTFRAVAINDLRTVSGVVTSNGVPVANAQIKLTYLTPTTTKSTDDGIRIVNFYNQTKGVGNDYYATTNHNGEFEAKEIVPGDYTISIASYQFVPFVKQISTENDNLNLGNIELTKTSAVLETAVSQANPVFSGLITLSNNNQFRGIKMRWTPSHIATAKLAGKPIKALYWYNDMSNVKAQANLYFGDKLVFSTQILTKSGANMTPVLGDLSVPADKDVYVEFTFPTNTVGSLVFIDNGPAKTGYGDLILEGSKYSTLKNFNINFNIHIGFSTDNPAQESALPTIILSKLGQYSSNILLGTTDAAVEKWIITFKGGELNETVEIPSGTVALNKLEPNTLYQVTAKPVLAAGTANVATLEFKTLPVTEKYPAILIAPDDEAKHLITVNNLQELPQKVEVYVNEELVSNSELIVSARLIQGLNNVVVKIIYADGLVETISRKYTVE